MWKAGYLREQMLLQSAQAAQASDRLVAYSRMESFIVRTSSQVFAYRESGFLGLYMQNVFFVARDTNVDFRCDALCSLRSWHCALSFPWGLGAQP
jgi:hypothetical protein